MDLYSLLQARGFISQISNEDIPEMLKKETVTVYAGFDPTADSLHLGHMVPVMIGAHFQRAGHNVIFLVGGATGMIGDPSGKSAERNLLTHEQVRHNTNALRTQLSCFVDFEGDNPARIVDNYDWIKPMSIIDWLRDVGKYFTINHMLAKDSVKSRIASENGISYTEFSYMTMQAYDFLHLFREYGCNFQMGGNDQWGNITAGTDLIRKVTGKTAYGITCPLITTATGEKFGKTAGNAVWLDPERTSPYNFYQYWISTDDRDVEQYLKFFTFLEIEQISQICQEHAQAPHKRTAQKRLAYEMTALVHGTKEADKAVAASQVLFGGSIEGLSDADLESIFSEVPSTDFALSALEGQGKSLIDLLAEAGICKSKGDARRRIQGGGVYLNSRKVEDEGMQLTLDSLEGRSILVIRSGKKNYYLAKFA